MPEALGAAVRAKYPDAFYFGTREPKGGEGRRKGVFWYFSFQFALFAISSKLPIRKNYQCHKMAATEKKLTFTVHKQLQLAFLNSPGVLDSLLRS